MKNKNESCKCPILTIQPILQGKWAMSILYFVRKGAIRFGELSRNLPMVTQANLTKTLRLLEKTGLVHREVYKEVPPKVEYSLTKLGTKFLPVMDALNDFAKEYSKA